MGRPNSIFRNMLYAFGAQGISMLLSILMALFLPKVLGVVDYSYWQLFVFYTSYAGFFHFGFNDGIYLQQAGHSFEELDYQSLNSELILSTFMQTIIGTSIVYVAMNILSFEEDRMFIVVATAIYVIICNYSGFLSCVLQITNRIREYSIAVVIDKVAFIVVVVLGIVTQCRYYNIYIILYIMSKILSTIFSMYCCKALVCTKIGNIRNAFRDTINNIRIGLNLTISNVASMLILGAGRSVIDYRWGVEAFGKLSLALSLSNFFLQFISQVSVVLFPAFKRLSSEEITLYYERLRVILKVILLGILFGYMPMYYLLSVWLPQYMDSLRYMAILLPICIFDGKMNMLCNTYLKVLRKERTLLQINLLTFTISFILCGVSAFVLDNIYAVTISMIVAIAFRSIVAETYLSRYFSISNLVGSGSEILLSAIFIIGTWYGGALIGFFVYTCAYIWFILQEKRSICAAINGLCGK